LLSHYIVLLQQRTIYAGFIYTNLFPTNCTVRSFDAPRHVGHEQWKFSGTCALHVSSTAVALWRCLWIMVKTCARPNCVLCIWVLKLPWWRISTKCSWADSRVKAWKLSIVSGTDSVPRLRVILMAWNNQNCFGYSKSSATHPEDRDGVSPRNVGELSCLDTAVCPRTFYWITFCAVGNTFVYIHEVEGRFANTKMLDSCLFATLSSWPMIPTSVRIKWRSAICSFEWAVVCFGLLLYRNNQIISYQLSIARAGVINCRHALS
jgi:hypothetical protein